MIDYLWAGGPVMIPIALSSVIALAVFLERLWHLQRSRVIPRPLVVELTDLVRQGRYEDALTQCRKRDIAISRVLEYAIRSRSEPRELLKERLEEAGRREAADLERYLPILGTIASITPLLGLLGTVGGMIITFQVIQEQGLGNVGNLAGGISQALITTFAGLSIGIPAVVANRYLLARVDALLLDLEEASIAILDLLVRNKDAA